MPHSLLEKTEEARIMRNCLRLMTKYGIFKFGDFTLKSGQKSPIYIDLRGCFAHMDLLVPLVDAIRSLVVSADSLERVDGIVGVPYGALPYASVLCTSVNKPLLIIRKEAKEYGTKKLIEGEFSPGQRVIVIEDVVTSGGSLKEVVTTLRAAGLVVEDVFCILDREQGGADALAKDAQVTLHSLLNMEKVLSFLISTSSLSMEKWQQVVSALSLPFGEPVKIDISLDLEPSSSAPLNGNSTVSADFSAAAHGVRLSLEAREGLAKGVLSKQIFSLMRTKKSNLCLAIDYTTTHKILELAEKAGPFVVAIKIHADIIEDFSEEFTQKLLLLANNHDFLIFEDRKFADTGATCALQAIRISSWADMVTVHAVQGVSSVCSAFRPIIVDEKTRLKGLLLIAQLSTQGSLINSEYTAATVKMGEENTDVVCGFICQERMSGQAGLIHWTPGVNLDAATDGKGQQWRSVQQAICSQMNDIVIVGRAITEKASPVAELRRYRDAAWNALEESLPN